MDETTLTPAEKRYYNEHKQTTANSVTDALLKGAITGGGLGLAGGAALGGVGGISRLRGLADADPKFAGYLKQSPMEYVTGILHPTVKGAVTGAAYGGTLGGIGNALRAYIQNDADEHNKELIRQIALRRIQKQLSKTPAYGRFADAVQTLVPKAASGEAPVATHPASPTGYAYDPSHIETENAVRNENLKPGSTVAVEAMKPYIGFPFAGGKWYLPRDINKTRAAIGSAGGGILGALAAYVLSGRKNRKRNMLIGGSLGLGTGLTGSLFLDTVELNTGGRYVQGARPPLPDYTTDPDPAPKERYIHISGAHPKPYVIDAEGKQRLAETGQAFFRWGEREEIKDYIRKLHQARPQDKIVIMSQSMGGPTALETVQDMPDVPFERVNIVDAVNGFSKVNLLDRKYKPANVGTLNNYLTTKPQYIGITGGQLGEIKNANNYYVDTDHGFWGYQSEQGDKFRHMQ